MSSSQNLSLTTALDFAKRGMFVFPLKRGEKKPAIKKWNIDSSNDRKQIKQWAKKFPNCNWAVDCGKSDLLVVDVDVRDGKPGRQSLFDYEIDHGFLPETYSVTTPSGGEHFYFRGKAPTTSQSVLGDGIDTRGAGGYVVLAGSKLISDSDRYVVVSNNPICLIPNELKEVLEQHNCDTVETGTSWYGDSRFADDKFWI